VLQPLQKLLHKEVSRKEFLSIAVLAALSVFGFGTIIQLLTGKSLESNHQSPYDYRAAIYGGTEEDQ
jgi:hypothetical protein